MKLKWYGHASFRITANTGVSVITDPYNPETSGYTAFTEPAHIVIMSSDNDSFHCNTHLVPGQHVTINALELARTGQPRVEHGISFSAIEAMEALNHREHHPDQNGMYRFSVDGVSIGHLGDVGNPLSDAHINFFKGVDVLLALAGGHPTMELDDLKTAIDRIQPKLVVPMHFRTLTYKPRNSFWVEKFLAYFDDAVIDFAFASEVTISPATLPAHTRVLVVDYARV